MKTNCLIYQLLLVSVLMINGCVSFQKSEVTPTKIVVVESPAPSTPTKVVSSATSIPTLAAEDIRQQLLYFLQENNGCRFPCIWGLTPGMSSTDRENYLGGFREITLSDFYSNTLFDQEFKVGGIGAQFITESTTVYTDLDAHEKNGAVEILLLRMYAVDTGNLGIQKFGDAYYTQLTKYYQPPEVLLKYGQPASVLLAAWQPDPIWKAPYDPMSLVLVYEDLGVMVEYVFPSKRVNEQLVGCPKGSKINVFAWSKNANLSLENIVSINPNNEGLIPVYLKLYKPIEEGTSFNLDEFYQTFQNPEECISTPVELWPPS